MKYLKRFNESYNHDTYEITDYFTDLEDEGLISIDRIRLNAYADAAPITAHNKVGIEGLYKMSKFSGFKNSAALAFGEYLDHFSIKSLQEFYNFIESEEYTPPLVLSLSVIDETKNNWVERIKESINRCERTSLVTKIFGMKAIPHGIGINRLGYADIFFIQTK